MSPEGGQIRVPPRGTKGGAFAMPGGKLMERIAQSWSKRQIARMRAAKTSDQATFMGFPVAVVTTVGAKSGEERSHVLGAFPDGKDAWLLIASKGGAATHPHWFFNIVKNPDKVWVQVGDRKFHAHVESLQGAEREQAYARVVAVANNYGQYLTKTDREIPVLRVTPA